LLPTTSVSHRPTFHIVNTQDLPDKQRYQEFYSSYDLRLADALPAAAIDKVHSVHFYILSAKLSPEFQSFHDLKNEELSRHNGIGFRLFDKNQTELGRVSFSYWACSPDKVGFPYYSNSGQLFMPNRAVVAFTISNGDWEGGYWTKEVFLMQISISQYSAAWDYIKEFASRYPYLAAAEIWNSQNQLLSPAVTCNTFVQNIVWKLAGRDVFKEGILAVSFAAVVTRAEADKTPDELPLKFVNYWLPRWYDEHGNVIAKHDSPELRIAMPHKNYLRNNVGLNMDLMPFVHCSQIAPLLVVRDNSGYC